MNVDFEVVARLLAPAVSALLTAVVKRFAESRAALTTYVGNVSTFELSDEHRTKVFTHSLFINNRSPKPIENVRVVHHIMPPHVYLFPRIEHTISPDTGEIIIPRLVPKEGITISYLYNPPLMCGQVHLHVKSDAGFAKQIDVVEIVKPSAALKWAMLLLTFVGASYVIYWAIKLAAYLASL